jgi:hypothetical protein
MPDITPAEMLRKAAALMRERAQKAAEGDWPGRPWAVTECADEERGDCACIVYQGERKPFDEPQVPGIHYVCDAETPEIAEHVAGMHPVVALDVAKWLGDEAERARGLDGREDSDAYPLMLEGFAYPLAVANAYLGEVS